MNRLIPVLTINDIEEIEPVFAQLRERKIRYAEITFRTPCTESALKKAIGQYPDMEIGAGTVINGGQCERALAAGARFIVSPGLSEEVCRMCAGKVPYYPGCATPTEIMKALSMGLTILKFFPASVYGGLKALKALSAPFPQVRWIPTGGIIEEDLQEYFAFDKVYAVGGSFLAKK